MMRVALLLALLLSAGPLCAQPAAPLGTFDRRRERSLASLGMTPRMRLPRRQLRRCRRTVVALKAVARGDALLDGPFGEALIAHHAFRRVRDRLDRAAGVAVAEHPVGDGVGPLPAPLQKFYPGGGFAAGVARAAHGEEQRRLIGA